MGDARHQAASGRNPLLLIALPAELVMICPIRHFFVDRFFLVAEALVGFADKLFTFPFYGL